jgi:hypothetical protein
MLISALRLSSWLYTMAPWRSPMSGDKWQYILLLYPTPCATFNYSEYRWHNVTWWFSWLLYTQSPTMQHHFSSHLKQLYFLHYLELILLLQILWLIPFQIHLGLVFKITFWYDELGKVLCMVIGNRCFDISLLWYVLITTGKLLVLFVFAWEREYMSMTVNLDIHSLYHFRITVRNVCYPALLL